MADRLRLHALGAATKLREEGQCDAAIPSYDAHFARMGAGPMEAVAFGEDRPALRTALSRFDAVYDEIVVRAVVAGERRDDYLAVLHASGPEHGGRQAVSTTRAR